MLLNQSFDGDSLALRCHGQDTFMMTRTDGDSVITMLATEGPGEIHVTLTGP